MKSKLLLGPVAIIGLIWGAFVLDGWWPWALLKSIYGTVFWLYPVMLIIDLSWSALGKNQRLLNDFYKSTHTDLIGISCGYLLLTGIYSLNNVSYNNSGIDLAAIGLPLSIMAIYRLSLASREKWNGKPVKRGILLLAVIIILIFITVSTLILITASNGELSLQHSIWIQITIFCISLYLYVESAKIHYFIKSGKIAHSSIHRYIFSDSESQLYEAARDKAIKYNDMDNT